MTTLREAAQQALEALILADSRDGMYTYAKEIAALRAALAEPEPYDQTALELCEVCGWKTLIPTEGCLNCERQPKAEPQKPVGTYEEVMQTMRSLQTGTLEQQQMFALLKDKPLYAEPQPKAEQEPVADGYYVMQVDGKAKKIWPMTEEQALVVAAPQPRKRLTREQAMRIVEQNPDTMMAIRMTEAAHGIEAAVWGEKT
jgi:hypothetical protein